MEDPDADHVARARWIKVNSNKPTAFIGKNVIAFPTSSHIMFFNIQNQTHSVYSAIDKESGDGVECLTGCRNSPLFAFAEKCENPGIFLLSYPSFQKISTIYDPEISRYKAVCMTESELIVGLSTYPNYVLTVWCWRTTRKLISVPTGINKRDQDLVVSMTHNLICHTWKGGLVLWDVAPCYKLCMIMPRHIRDIEVQPLLSFVVWTNEGHLYGVNQEGNLYSVVCDGIGMVCVLEYSSNISGPNTPLIAFFKGGFTIYGPDFYLRHIKKSDKKWTVTWVYELKSKIINLLSGGIGDTLIATTDLADLLRISMTNDGNLDVADIFFMPRNILSVSILNPIGDYLVTRDASKRLYLWETDSGILVKCFKSEGDINVMASSPKSPLLAICGEGSNGKHGATIILFDQDEIESMSSVTLTYHPVDNLAWQSNGRNIVASVMSAGHIFLLKVIDEKELEISRMFECGRALSDVWLMEIGPLLRVMSLVLCSNKYLIGEKVLCYNAVSGQENKVAGKIQGPYRTIILTQEKEILIAIPHLSKNAHVLKFAGERGVNVTVQILHIINLGHELNCFSMALCVDCLVTWGLDGLVFLREAPLTENYWCKIIVSHRYGYGVLQAAVCPQRRFVITLSKNNTLINYGLNNESYGMLSLPPTKSMIFHDPMQILLNSPASETWQDLLIERQVEEEKLFHEKARTKLMDKFLSLQKRLVGLIEENEEVPALHKLSMTNFNLNVEVQTQMIKQGSEEREKAQLQLESRIAAQEMVTDWIKETCWNSMAVPSTWLFAIFSYYEVENYSILPFAKDFNDKWDFVLQCRAIEMAKDNDLFTPWIERVANENVTKEIAVMHPNEDLTDSYDEEIMKDIRRNENLLSGTMSHCFITPVTCSYSQFASFSFLQTRFQEVMAKFTCNELRLWFNKQFDEMMSVKKREVGLVKERNKRFRVIISELNILAELRGSPERIEIVVEDPEWSQLETVENVIKVEPYEVSIPPYVSPSQIVIPPPELGPKDDFRERALMRMMDGVLEKLWHEEIKKPIPKPQCLIDKKPEDFNEDDLKQMFEYESKVALRNQEREKYRRMLVAEYAKLSGMLNEGIVRFNSKVKDLQILKMRVESAIGQEQLKLMRMRCNCLDRIENSEKESKFMQYSLEHEREIEKLQSELKLIQERLSESHSAYEALAARDRSLDKNFKNNFPDLAPVVIDQCYRMFKRRPKWQQRANVTPSAMMELAQACLNGDKAIFMQTDCLEYAKGMDALDSINNMPPVMDENLWLTMCKLRRVKVENEMRMRAVALEAASTDATANNWSRAAAARRSAFIATQRAQRDLMADIEAHARNVEIQLVLSAGQLELPTSGHKEDFDDAALLKTSDVQLINNLIMEAGKRKLREMRQHMNFRRGILSKEWEHAQLKMRIRHLEQELYNVNRIKVTKELQEYLSSCYRGRTDDQDYFSIERDLEASKVAFNKLLLDQIQRAEDMEIKVQSINNKNKAMDQQIYNMKLDVANKRLSTDPMEAIIRKEKLKKKMMTLMWRTRLINEVQQNHITVVMLQTELELLRLKTYPTLSGYRTLN